MTKVLACISMAVAYLDLPIADNMTVLVLHLRGNPNARAVLRGRERHARCRRFLSRHWQFRKAWLKSFPFRHALNCIQPGTSR